MSRHPNEQQVPVYRYRILECYGAGMDFNHYLVPTTPDMGGDTFHSTRFLKASSNLAFNNIRVGVPTTSLGNPVQCLTALNKKIISNIHPKFFNVYFFNLYPFLFLLLLWFLTKSPSLASL